MTRTKVALEFLEDDSPRESILEDVIEMERLISDLLESERLNTRHSKLQLASTDLVQLVRDIVEADFSSCQDRIRVDALAEPVVEEIDPTRIRLLIKNLIDNAICYSTDDTSPVEIRIARQSERVSVEVIDHGSGMSASQVERATEPFYRADPARCRDTGGFGLGLYLCRRIAEAHGGELKIASEQGRGTQVTLSLPAGIRVDT